MATVIDQPSPQFPPGSLRFFGSSRWPVITLLVYVGLSIAAFTPRLVDYVTEGHWGRSATNAFEFAPMALNTHALFGMALIPLFLLQPILGLKMDGNRSSGIRLFHRWQGRFLALASVVLSLLGLYITYTFAMNSDSITSVIFMFLVALFVIIFFVQAIIEARKHRIARHLDALVFAMIFLSVPATGRIIENSMNALGVENTRSKELVSIGFGFEVELVDLTILMVASGPLILWALFAIPRGVFLAHGAKLSIAVAFVALPLAAILMQTLTR
ncbi:MAG: DUF2306 domain-containing protein [Pseudomonadota bacterium]